MPLYRRRVQKIGKNTYIITLPSAWAREVGLEPRAEVYIDVMPDLSLRLYKALDTKSGEPEIDIVVVDGYNEYDVAREIIAFYISGASIMRIHYESIPRAVVDRGVDIARDRLIGLEVVDEDSNIITLQVVVDPNLSDFEGVVKRLKRIAISMHRDIIRFYLGEEAPSILDSVIARDNLADKLYLLALRQLTLVARDPYEMGKRGLDHVEVIHRVMFIKSLERIADHAVNMARIAKALGSVPPNIVELYRATVDLFDGMSDALIDMDKEKAMKLVKEVEKLKAIDEEMRRTISSNKGLDYHLARFMDIVSRILARTIDVEENVVDILAIKTLKKIDTASKAIS